MNDPRRHRRLTLTHLLVGLVGVLFASLCVADGRMADPETAIEMAGDALDDSWYGDKNWYDGDTDGLRPLRIRPPKPKKTANNNPNTTNRGSSGFWDWLDGWLGGIHPNLNVAALLRFIVVTTLLIAVAMIVIWLIRVYLRNEQQRFTRVLVVDPRATNVDRVEALPMAVDEAVSDLLAEARRRRDAGDLAAAIVYLFSHQLLELDRHHLIRLVKGKTNRQYLREIKRNADSAGRLQEIVRETVLLFENVFFGRHAPSQLAFASCWNQVDEFDRLVRAAARDEEQS